MSSGVASGRGLTCPVPFSVVSEQCLTRMRILSGEGPRPAGGTSGKWLTASPHPWL